MKTICIVSTNADPAGAPTYVHTLVSHLSKRYPLHCVFGERGPIERKVRSMGIDVTVVDSLRSVINPVRDLQCWRELGAVVRELQPALLHAHSTKAAMIARLVADASRIPCLYTVHGWGFGPGRPRLQSLFVRTVETYLAFRSARTRYLYVSAADQAQGRRSLHLSPRQGRVILNAVPDHGERARPDQSDIVLMAARVAYQKDHETLLRGYEEADWGTLYLAGENTNSDEFLERVKRLAPRRRGLVQTFGRSENIPQMMAHAAVFALSSRYEGLPLTIIEAMCAGLPIIATDVGGVRELISDGDNGLLVPLGDWQAWKAALQRLADPHTRARMGQASRRRYERDFTIEKMIAAVASEYEMALAANNF
jgi:glycosyltransferase involved in cell wall biosynthesis